MTLFSQRYLLADIDDTVLEFAKCFQDWAVARGHPANGNVRENGDIGRVFGIDDQACWNLIEEFYADPSFGELTPEPDALEILPVLHEFGCEFGAIFEMHSDSNGRKSIAPVWVMEKKLS
jgi:hypothetical protein